MEGESWRETKRVGESWREREIPQSSTDVDKHTGEFRDSLFASHCIVVVYLAAVQDGSELAPVVYDRLKRYFVSVAQRLGITLQTETISVDDVGQVSLVTRHAEEQDIRVIAVALTTVADYFAVREVCAVRSV
jgi:hypothetical protein